MLTSSLRTWVHTGVCIFASTSVQSRVHMHPHHMDIHALEKNKEN